MVARATDILSVTDAADALRIDDLTPAIRLQLTADIEAAVQFVGEYLGYPLLDRTMMALAERPAIASNPIWVESVYVKAVTGILYWAPDQDLREEPAGLVPVAVDMDAEPPITADDIIGRVAQSDRYTTAIYPPKAGWPAVLSMSKFSITYTEGLADPLPHLQGIRRAVATLTAGFYEGAADNRHRIAAMNILSAFIDGRYLL